MKRTLNFFLTLTAAWFFGAAAYAADNAPPAAHPSVSDAKAILQKMSQQLAQAPGFSVTIRSDYDAIQSDGQSIAFGNKYQVSLQRPGQLRIDATRSDGDQDMTLFDGKTLTAYRSQDNVYAQVGKPGTVDELVVYMVQGLQMTVPLARMLLTTLPQELESNVQSVSYVEKDVLMDVPTDHIVATLQDIDLELWVTQGAQLLPRKVIITYKHARGQPQFRAELSDWRLAPVFKPELFAWSPPQGAELITFLAPVRAQHPDSIQPVPAEKGVAP
jgi:hypothetical protein